MGCEMRLSKSCRMILRFESFQHINYALLESCRDRHFSQLPYINSYVSKCFNESFNALRLIGSYLAQIKPVQCCSFQNKRLLSKSCRITFDSLFALKKLSCKILFRSFFNATINSSTGLEVLP